MYDHVCARARVRAAVMARRGHTPVRGKVNIERLFTAAEWRLTIADDKKRY